MAALELRGFAAPRAQPFTKLEQMIPELVNEMRADLKQHRLYREFVLLKKAWSYNASKKDFFVYYYDDHEDLESKVQILMNYGAAVDITYNNTSDSISTRTSLSTYSEARDHIFSMVIKR